jgi:hypothetical protein
MWVHATVAVHSTNKERQNPIKERKKKDGVCNFSTIFASFVHKKF